MPIFSIQAPDGKTYRVQGPNQAGAIEYLKSQLAANQSTQPSQPNYNPPGTGLGRALKRGVNRTGQAFNLAQANIAANTLRGMDVNKVETLDRALKLSMPPSTYEAVRKYAWDGLESVETQEDLDRWLNSLQQLGVGPQNIAKIQAMTKAAEATKTDYRQEGGKFDQIRQSGVEALEAAQKKQQNIDALPMSPTAQTGAQDFQDAEGVLDWAKKSFKNPLGALAFIGEIAAESTPSIAAGIGTSILTGNLVAGAGVMILSGAPQSYSGEFVDFLREEGIDLSNAEEIGQALRNDDILTKAHKRGITKAAIIGFFEALGMKAGGGILRQTLAQSATGGGGEGASTYVLDGKIDAKDVALEAVAETATVPGEVAIIKGRSLFTKDGNLVDPNSLDADQKQAAASVAQLLRQTANQNGLNLKNVNASSTKGAKQALEDAHETISNQLKDITANKAVKGFLSPKNAKTLDELIDDYSAAAVALRQGKNKVKSKVMQKNYDAIMRLLPDSAEKTQIANLLKMSNQVTDLFNNGLKGGLSQYTDYFFPLAPSGAAYDPNRTASAAIGTVSAITTFGKTLAIPAAGRIVDFFTGRRSSVARFVKKNENRLGLAKPDGPSLIKQAEQKKATSKARRQAVAKIATILNAPKPGFVENILLGTGLDRNGLETVLNNMAADFASDPEFTSILNDIQSNLDAEGVEYLDVLTEIIPVIGAYAQANSPDLITNTPDNPLLKREFEGPNVDPTSPTQPQNQSDLDYGPKYTTQENYNRGIEDNKAFRQDLENRVLMNPDIKGDEQIRLLASLIYLRDNLGSSPVPNALQEIQDLEDSGVVSQENIDTYVRPYVNRIIKQQRRNAPMSEEARIVPVPFNNSRMQEIFGVSEPTQGGNYIDLDTKEDLTGNTYTGGKVSIVDGKPVLETQDTTSDPSTKADGRIVRVNLFKQKAGWKWVDNEDGPSTIVSTEVGNKHYYSLSSDFQTPVTLQTYPNKPSEPRLRPTTQGEVVLGNQVGSINLRGNIRPVYDEVRIVSKQQNNTGPVLSQADESINPNIPLPTFDKEAALAPTTPIVHQQIDAPKGKTNFGLLPHLRTKTESFRDGKPLFFLKTTNQNAGPQIQAIDEVLQRHPDPASSPEAWGAMLGDAFASEDIPVQPHGFIEDITNGGAQELLSSLTPGQIADADHGFKNAAEFRRAYTSGEIGVEDTGRLFLWSFLSKGVSPYVQEGLFMDSFNGIDPYIQMAADGTLKDNMDGYKKWASTTAPKGSGKPGAGAMHNLNAFGKDFLLKMSQDAGKGDGRSRLQVIHDMMSDPNTTGKEVRREFLRMGEGVGIDNKVVSFTLLVAGYPDVMVLDRVQMRQMWNDGRFTGLNLYDGYKHNGNVVNGSGMALTSTGARGLLVYEAMEKSLQNRLNQIYTDVGRPQAASVGRYHWETWVASSQQEASHGTIDAILARAKGDPNPLDGVTAKQGEYGEFSYGARYGLENGVPMFTYDIPDRGTYKFTVPDFQSFLNDIKRKAKNNKVIPDGFSVSQSGNAPWYTREGVNLDALAEKAKEYGKQIQGTNDGIRQGSSVSDGRTADAISRATDEQRVPALADRSSVRGRGPSGARNTASPLLKTSLERVKQAILAVRPAFQVGKKGGRLEDGVQDIDTAVEIANGLGMTVKLFNSIDEMNDAKREAGQPPNANSAGTFYRGVKETQYGLKFDKNAKGFEGTVFTLNPGAIVSGQPISDTQALMTLLHEMSHGITLGNMQLSERQNMPDDFFNPYNDDFDFVPKGSFAHSALLEVILDSSPEVSKGVLQEIQDLQEKVDVYTSKNPKERSAVRHIRSLYRKLDAYEQSGVSREGVKAAQGHILDYLRYTRNIRETAADPVAVYLLNPKLAKKLMPKTTALIRSEFSKAQNPKLQFFSHPFAVVAAVVMAMMAARDEEEERRRMMPPPGALNQPMQPGALSA